MEAEGASQPSQMDDEDMEHLARGYSPDIKAMPTRSTGRYDLSPGVERDAAALAHMLPTQPSDADRDEVAFQAWRDAAIQMKPTQEDDETVVLRAASSLGRLSDGDEASVRALAKLTSGSDHERHLVAIGALGDVGGTLALRYLDTLTEGHPEEGIRHAARQAAARARGGASTD